MKNKLNPILFVLTAAVALLFVFYPLNPAQGADSDGNTSLANPKSSTCKVLLRVPKFLCVNDDDDQSPTATNYEKWDWEHSPSSMDDDLKPVTIAGVAGPGGGTLTLSIHTGGDKIGDKFWKDGEKVTEQTTFSWPVPANSAIRETVYIEGKIHSDEKEDVVLKAVMVCNPSPDGSTAASSDEVFKKTTVYQIDLDVDSGNDSGFDFAFTDDEDKIEASEKEINGRKRPGKIVLINSGNSDDDDVLDYADGFSLDGAPSDLKEFENVGSDLKFVPVQVELKKPFNPNNAKVTFIYEDSEPELGKGLELIPAVPATATTPAKPSQIKVKKGGMRLWRKPPNIKRSGKAVSEEGEGDFIKANKEIPWRKIAKAGNLTTTKLYLEYVDKSEVTANGRKLIKVVVTEGKALSEDSAHVTLLPVEFKDYFGGSVFHRRVTPKCCKDKVKKNMLTHLYPNKGSEKCVYSQNGDTLDVSVLVSEIKGLKYELIYELHGKEIKRIEVQGKNQMQVIKYDLKNLGLVNIALARFGIEASVYLLVTNKGQDVLKSPKLKFLIDSPQLRNQFFKIKIEPLGIGWKGKGSSAEVLMGMMLHEVSREIVSLVEKNTKDHTTDKNYKLQDPRATQGTNRLIISGLESQIGKAGSEWDKAADHALVVEKKAYIDAQSAIVGLNFVKARRVLIDAIFHDAFNEFEKIENKLRGKGWGKYGCPCGGDKAILKAASLRGVNSKEVLKVMAQYSPAAATGIALLPASFIKDQMKRIQKEKIGDLQKNFDESWKIGGCCK